MDTAAIDRDLAVLQEHAGTWIGLDLDEKIRLLDRLVVRTSRRASEWVEVAAKAKGLRPDAPLVGEEWMSGPYALLVGIHAISETLKRVRDGRDVLAGFPVRTRADGRVAVRVYPAGLQERLLLSGLTAEVWMQPGVTERSVRANAAALYRGNPPPPTVTLVLGAGNIASIAPLDLISILYGRGSVAMLKMNPVNEYLGPILEDIFAPLVDAGAVRFAYGGADVGEYLTRHPAVDAIHMTGSAHTHDAIVYGTGPDAAERKRDDRPVLDKPMTSELGGVGPTIVVPGPWSDADIAFQAEHVLTQKLHNVGFNCIADQVLVLPDGWEGTDRLVEAISDLAGTVEPRPAYYPGAKRRWERIVAAHPTARTVTGGEVPFTLIEDVDPESDAACFRDEVFGPVLATTRLPARDLPTYLAAAISFANDRLVGTLGANLLVHPRTIRYARPLVDAAVEELRYGTIAVNTWTGVGFLLARATWGAFPGHHRNDIQSGTGVVHNALLLDRPERTVLHGPFAPMPRSFLAGERHVAPKPPFFVTHAQAALVGERLTRYAADPSWRRFLPVVAAALRG